MTPYVKTTARSIKNSFARFMAILAIIALGVGFYSGLSLTMPSFIKTGNKFINDHKLFDFRLISTVGFTDDDLLAISQTEGIATVQGAVFADAVTDRDGSEGGDVVRFHSITYGVNELEVKAGRMPASPDEIVVDDYRCPSSVIGSVLRISDVNTEDTLDRFVYDEYTIVGTVRSPYYLNFQRGTTDVGGGSLSYFAYVPIEGLEHEYYTEAFVYMDLGLEVYSDEYDAAIERIEDTLETVVERTETDRFDADISEARDELADGIEEFEDARHDALDEIGDARQELSDAQDEIDQARIDLADAADELEDARIQIDDGQAELNNARRTINDNEARLNEAEAQINDGLSQANATRDDLLNRLSEVDATLEELRASLEQVEGGILLAQQAQAAGQEVDTTELTANRDLLTAGIAEAEAGRTQITDGIAAADAAIAELNGRMAEVTAGRAQIEDARWDVYTGQQDLDQAREELSDGEAEYEDGLSEFSDALVEFEDGKREFQSGLTDFNDAMTEASLQLYGARLLIDRAASTEVETYVLGRDTNVGYVAFDSDARIVAGIANVFPLFFFALAALVCSTTMQRMVTDERTQIGTMRALGYSEFSITMKYVIYSGLASVIGSIGGYLGGIKLFPYVIWQVYGMMYGFAPIEFETNKWTFLLSLSVALICSVGVTVVTAQSELQGMPAELIRPKAPPAGKKILLEKMTFLWKQLKFTSKVSVRNIFRFKKRMFMMIIGIAGCTALLITGFGINDSINNIVDYQYDTIQTYDIQITFKDGTSRSTISDVMENAREATGIAAEGVYVNSESITHTSGDAIRDVYLFASDDPDISKALKAHIGEQDMPWPSDGQIAISSKLAAKNGLSAGDAVTFGYGDEGREFTLTVAYVFDNYIFHMAYMNAATYEQVFGEEYTPDTLLITGIGDGSDVYAFASSAASDDSVRAWSVTNESRSSFRETMKQLNKVVFLIIGCAAALAFIVLFNLNNINITERIREIATIKVLGFTRAETGSYFFRENFLLVFMGFVPGIPLGIALHRFVMAQIEMDTVTFIVRIVPVSYLYSLCFVILFSVIVDLVMRAKINRIDMAESLKSAE